MHFRIGIQRRDWSLEMSIAIEGRVLLQVVLLQRQILMGTRRGWGLVPYCSIRKTNIDGKAGRSESGNVRP